MEYHRSLYKSNPSNSSTRRTANELRATKRRDLHCSTRNISLSPAQINSASQQETQKENCKPPGKAAPLEHQTDKSTEINCQSSENVEKQTRRKAFLMRYLFWKEKKQALLKEEKLKKPAFVVPSGSGTGCRTVVEQGQLRKPLAPKNHIFKPPANLKDIAVQIIGSHSMRLINGIQEEIFHFVETPKKKSNLDSKVTSLKPIALPTTSSKPSVTKAIVQETSNRNKKVQQTPKVAVHLNSKRTNCSSGKAKTNAATTAPQVALPSKQEQSKSEKKSAKPPKRIKTNPPIQPVSKPFEKHQTNLSSATKKTVAPQKTNKIFQKTESANAIRKDTTAKQRNCKSGLAALQRPTFKAGKKPLMSNTLHASKGTSHVKTSVVKQISKENGKSAVDVATKISNVIPETPTDLCPEQSYLNFVTSTKRKSSSKGSNSDQLFTELGNTISPVDDCSPAKSNHKSKSDSKFNFLRYSVASSDKNNVGQPEERDQKDEPKATPEKPKGPFPTYMSPYVSVSRGKVSSRIEREKRNSVYMVPDTCSTSPEMTTAVRHTIATVHYYRKQLNDEINRLINQCATWEQYKETNAKLIEDAGSDMINATIGQTRLLTSKKLKQFGDLIDRCENGVLGKNATVAKDDESAKPILPEDLEGFWSMVGLQIENVDKRFANLERWKSNNWTDPDEVPAKPVTNAIKVKKTKKTKPITIARPNGALQKILRTAHAAYLNKKAAGVTDEDVILTPSKRQVVIRDRRSRSTAATVITVNSPQVNRKSNFRDAPSTDLPKTPKLVPHINGLRKSLNLLKSTLLNEQEKKSPLIDFTSPPASMKHSRKSILKTPGSTCKRKSVVFNSPTIKFTIEDEVDDGSISPTSAEFCQRTYKLRNRRVILRDSSEFVIPQ